MTDLTPEQRAEWRERWAHTCYPHPSADDPAECVILALLDALDDADKARAAEKARADKAEHERDEARDTIGPISTCRTVARAVLDAVADDLRAEAWTEGYAAGYNDDTGGPNPYRADEKETT